MHLYVIKFSNGTYWCGYNKADKQLRKAKIYTSLRIADDVGKDALTRLRHQDFNADSYQVVEVDLKEIG